MIHTFAKYPRHRVGSKQTKKQIKQTDRQTDVHDRSHIPCRNWGRGRAKSAIYDYLVGQCNGCISERNIQLYGYGQAMLGTQRYYQHLQGNRHILALAPAALLRMSHYAGPDVNASVCTAVFRNQCSARVAAMRNAICSLDNEQRQTRRPQRERHSSQYHPFVAL